MKQSKFVMRAILAALLLFFPVPLAVHDDGGTREYIACIYKIVKWNRLVSVYNHDGIAMERIDVYSNIDIYWFPNNFKSIDELWEMKHESKE